MILNEQLIQDMFQEENSKDLISLPREDISLNFTVSSRSSKNPRKQYHPQQRQQQKYEPAQILEMAALQISKFNQWAAEAQNNCSFNFDNLGILIQQIEMGTCEMANHDDLMIIKGELFKHEQYNDPRMIKCLECTTKDSRIEEQQQMIDQLNEAKALQIKETADLEGMVLRSAVLQTKQYILNQVENNLLKDQIRDLYSEINVLKNQKITLERTFLFNKTRNSEINILQKSKDLSAAKNSTNSSQILNRNHETIVFLDPIESDVQQWIKFFESQKNRYIILCKKQGEERQKQLGRLFNKQQKQSFQNEDRVCILFHSIKEILRNLLKIRQNTAAFEQSQSMNKSGLRQKMLKSNQQQAPLKQQYEKLHCKFTKLVKINQYLLRQRQNLEQINTTLKHQRLRQNNQRNSLTQLLKKESSKGCQLYTKIKEYEESIKRSSNALIQKEQQLLYSFQEIKKLKKYNTNTVPDKNWNQLQNKCKSLEKKYIQKLKQYEFQRNSYIFKLKKQALDRRRYYNQIEQIKGSFRVYCKMLPNSKQLASNDLEAYLHSEMNTQSVFHNIVSSNVNTQDIIYNDIKRLLVSVFDGYQLTIFNYGHSESGKASFIYEDQQNLVAVPKILKQVFKIIEAQKDYKVQVSLNICQFCNQKLIDLTDNEISKKTLEGKNDNLSLSQLPQFVIDSTELMEQMYTDALRNKKTREKYQPSPRSHLIVRANLQINNLKTNQKYKSKINLIHLADSQKIVSNDPVGLKQYSAINKNFTALAKCLFAFNNKQKLIPYRENKFTNLLKDCFNASNKIMMIVSVAASMSREQIKHSLNFAESSKIGERMPTNQEGDYYPRGRRSISQKNI